MREKLDEYIVDARAAMRFSGPAVLAAWLVCLAGWTVVFLMPSRYDTAAKVYVDTNTLLRPLLEGLAVNPSNGTEVDMLRRALLARPQLDRVISATGLEQRVHDEVERADLIGELATRIRITGDPQSKLYSIAFGDYDPQISYAVVKELLARFVGEATDAKRADSDSAQKFLGDQLREMEGRLTDSEMRLANFKKKNIGYMPDDRGGYFERLQREMQDVDRLDSELSVAKNKRAELRSKLLGSTTPGGSSRSVMQTSVDARLVEARQRLDDMLLRYTEIHPDVVALQEAITSLELQRSAELESLRSSTGALGTPRTGQTNLVLQNLQIALNDVEVEIASKQSQLDDHRSRIASLRSNMNVLPEVEAELARLNRDYGINRTRYDLLLQRLESARLSDKADRSDDLKFRVIEPPVVPLSPAAPKRALLVAAVLLLGLGAGGAMAWLLSRLKPVFSNLTQLRAAFAEQRILGALTALQPLPGSSDAPSRIPAVVLSVALVGLVVACGALLVLQTKADLVRQVVFGWLT